MAMLHATKGQLKSRSLGEGQPFLDAYRLLTSNSQSSI